jgi:enamine deaminase RidA (YjgF/YER057c/UK114 family)
VKPEPIKSDAPAPLANYCEAYRVGQLVFVAGQVANDYVTGIPPEARIDSNFPYYGSDIKRQTRYVLENFKKTFEAAGSSLANVIKAQVFMTDLRDFSGFDEVWKDYFGDGLPPRTTVGTTGLLGSGSAQLIEIDLIAHTNDVSHESVQSSSPRPIANYTEAVRVGNLVFTAGQLANDFVSGIPPEARVNPAFPYYGSEIKLQTRFVLENYKRTLAAADSSLQNVVKAQVFLRDLNDFNGFDEVWREYFGDQAPPRTTVGTTELLGSGPSQRLEIDLIAHTSKTKKRVITSDNPRPLANYSEAVVVDGLVFAAGQLASDFKTGVPAEARINAAFPYYGSDIKLQTGYVLRNLARTFKAAGSSLSNAFKAQVFLTNLHDFAGFDEVWRQHFGDRLPARTTIGTTGLLVRDTLVEIDLIGAVD